jgi:hypothetical protein
LTLRGGGSSLILRVQIAMLTVGVTSVTYPMELMAACHAQSACAALVSTRFSLRQVSHGIRGSLCIAAMLTQPDAQVALSDLPLAEMAEMKKA